MCKIYILHDPKRVEDVTEDSKQYKLPYTYWDGISQKDIEMREKRKRTTGE